MEADKILDKINPKLLTAKTRIQRDGGLSQAEFNEIKQLGGMWYFDELNGDWWFSRKEKIKDEISKESWDFVENGGNAFESEVDYLGNIFKEVTRLNEEFAKKQFNSIRDKEFVLFLKRYLPLLSEHQWVCSRYMVNRWDYVSLKKNDASRDKIQKALDTTFSIRKYIKKPNEKFKVQYNHTAGLAWALVGSGLFKEAIDLWEAVGDLMDFIKKEQSRGEKKDVNLVVNRLERNIEFKFTWPRFRLSSYIGLARAYVCNGQNQKAKNIYRKIFSLHVSPVEKWCPSKLATKNEQYGIHYACGQNRIIESAVEWYKIAEEKEKKDLEIALLNLITILKKECKCENKVEASKEQCLIAYAILKDVLGEKL